MSSLETIEAAMRARKEAVVLIATSSGIRKFHRPAGDGRLKTACGSAEECQQIDRSHALAHGFKPCQTCFEEDPR